MKKPPSYFSKFITGIVVFLWVAGTVYGQLPRERVEEDPEVDRLFWAPVNIGISTVENVAARNLNTSVAHTFGLVSRGIEQFYGLDAGANTRIGLDYGVTDRFSLGIGRMTFNKVVDIRTKVNILRQTVSGSTPVDLAFKASAGISTLPGAELEFPERLSYLVSVMAARKFNRVSVQVTPMLARFNRVAEDHSKQLFGLGILAAYELNDRFALSAEYLPVLGDRHPNTDDALAIALNIDTGGHVFQILFSSSQWHNEQYIMTNNRHRFWEGDFRFGFNIHRVFGLGSR